MASKGNKSAAAKKGKAAPAKAAAAAGESNGIYVRNFPFGHMTYHEVRDKFSVYGKVQQMRTKRNLKTKNGAYVLCWFETSAQAKAAFDIKNTAGSDDTKVEWIAAAKPVKPASEVCSTVVVSGIPRGTARSKATTQRKKELRTAYPNASKVKLYRGSQSHHVGSAAVVYFKTNADATQVYKKLSTEGKLNKFKVSPKWSYRTAAKDKKKFVAPLKATAAKAAAVKGKK
eukprot:TRINITY_DN12558_c0_g1_i1.p1 TRINITY_DN12558_c0_g1~~TRINITY_DN12558_c0_g1_i1.p1  ORF type:complete len:245 (+),score=92.23 TRINITY_DN12558_c0_g1_i1:50-736(+)